MTDVYHKVGSTFYDYFIYSTTGLTDSDFTKQVDKNGVAGSTTGVTVAEIGSTRAYVVTVNGSTGFASAVGNYNLQIYRTSAPDDRWQSVVRVTADGTGDNTGTGTPFTSTSGDGRVVDSGGSPLANARVVISRPSGGGFYASLLTNSLGNWGPLYFDADGVWTFVVQLAGYSVGSGSVTVSSGIPTGPGDDVTLTAVSTTSLTLSQLMAYARRMYRDRTGSKVDAELTQAVNEALQMLRSEHDWPWYQTIGSLTFRAVYTAGTVATTKGSTAVVLTGGSFPYTTVGVDGVADLYINGMPHRLASITDATHATLASAWTETSYSGTYSLAQTEYTLPADLVKLSRITSTSSWVWGPDPVSRYDLEIARQQWRLSSTQPPRMWAIERDRLCIWPAPSADQQVNLLYLRRPDELVSSGDLADWDPNQIELLRRAIDYQIACRGDCVAGDKDATYTRYRESLARNIDQDRTAVIWSPGAMRGSTDDFRYGATITG